MTNTNPAPKKVGRPPVYTGLLLTFVQAVMLAVNVKFAGQGVSKTRKLLANTGAVRKSFERKYGVDLKSIAADVGCDVPKCKISGVTLVKIGKEMAKAGTITLSRGRPKKVAA